MKAKNRLHSLTCACVGIITALKSERNIQIHSCFLLLTLCLCYYYQFSVFEWSLVLLCNGLVIATELVNTSIEHLSNGVSGEYSQHIKQVKDIAAGAVLITALVAMVIGILLFMPYIINSYRLIKGS